MIVRNLTLALTAAIALATTGFAQAQQTHASYPGSEYAKYAKVSLTQARAIALGVVHGTIVGQELEKESGGSGLRYSFDIKVGNVTREVGVDAVTGRVLENSVEGANPD